MSTGTTDPAKNRPGGTATKAPEVKKDDLPSPYMPIDQSIFEKRQATAFEPGHKARVLALLVIVLQVRFAAVGDAGFRPRSTRIIDENANSLDLGILLRQQAEQVFLRRFGNGDHATYTLQNWNS